MFRTEIGRHIEALADRLVLATVPALALFLAFAFIRVG